nr:hypothetical protein [Candidatus Hamiltonella defensa]
MVQAYRAFSELPSTAEPKARQDLIVNGALSVAGATLNIGMAIAFAVGGQASLLAGPAGLIMGGGLVLGGMIYSAVRQVEELKKWVQLSVLEELDSGWRLFSGEYLAPELANQASRHQMLAHAQAEHQKAQTAQFQTLLLSHGQIEKVYGSLGQILLTPQRYKKIVAHHAGIEEDRVHPDEITQGKRALSDKLNRLKSNLLISGEMTVEDSDYEYYSPTLTSRDDRSDADIMMTLSAGHRQSLGRFVDENTQSLTASLEMKGRHRAPGALGILTAMAVLISVISAQRGCFSCLQMKTVPMVPSKKWTRKTLFTMGFMQTMCVIWWGTSTGMVWTTSCFSWIAGLLSRFCWGNPRKTLFSRQSRASNYPRCHRPRRY